MLGRNRILPNRDRDCVVPQLADRPKRDLDTRFTPCTIRAGVRVGPERNDRLCVSPVARILTELPPMSTTSTRSAGERLAAVGLVEEWRKVPFKAEASFARLRLAPGDELTFITASLQKALRVCAREWAGQT
jgi:hypothetical protein